MGTDRVEGGAIAADIQEEAGEYDPPAAWETGDTLANDLIDVVDDIRTIPAELGVRPYRLFLVHARWSGGADADGQLEIIAEREVVPPPAITDISGIAQVLRSTGVTEEGDVRVTEISARFSEDDLMGLTPDLVDQNDTRKLMPGVEFFYEMREARDTNPMTVYRRLVPTATPSLSRDGLQWTLTLTRQDGGRARDGTLVRAL